MWFIIFAGVLVLLLLYAFKINKYWEERGVPYVKPLPFFGNIASTVFGTKQFVHVLEDLYYSHPNKRYVGFYQFISPILLIRDPELIKRITVQDFDTFPVHRQLFVSPEVDPLWSKNLFGIGDVEKWHDMRSTLSPSFTSSKMKMMFELMKDCSHQFTNYFLNQGESEVEMKDAFTRFTNDVIATTAFGVNCDSLKDPNNEFYLMGKDATNFDGIRRFRFLLGSISPGLMKLFKIGVFGTVVSNFFRGLIKETIKLREENKIIRKDMVSLLMAAKKGALKDDNKDIDSGFAVVQEADTVKVHKRQKVTITDEDITAQALIFFIAGFDTASTLMSFTAYELCVNQDIQEKLRNEIDETLARCNGDFTYEALIEMKYLDMVISESLRKWPPALFNDRMSVKPITIEAELPGEETVILDKGTSIWIGTYPLHRDPKYYPNPDKFDPERFNDENKHKIRPYTYIPFGAGPRNCIGSRFALLEGKLVIAEILSKFEIVPVAKTQIPIVFGKRTLNPVPENGFWMGLKPRIK